ncbi:MAG: putative CXXCH cytochrome family protein [Lysobacterales bacterium]|jgi:predicted CXXCH cytochrome family protein
MRSLSLISFAVFWAVFSGPVFSAAGFAGSQACAGCHDGQYDAWKGSHHELAMQHANSSTVLGDFNNREFTNFGMTSRFYLKDGRYFVNTDGPDGRLQDFEIKYTFGVVPLQQYLVEFPDGRIQALEIAWDSRPGGAGGQRWFHLYPDERIDHKDELHWTGAQMNWNYMCADCHTTNFKKGYREADNSFKSTWSEMDVGCEACHGPGKQHIEWTEKDAELAVADVDKGLNFLLHERRDVNWSMDAATGTAKRSRKNTPRVEIEVCATCHSRRGIIKEGAVQHPSFLDHYQPALLTEGLYHADGQINDEVYVWGSFQQSKMFAAGVTCSDCHDPHSLKLRAEGEAVCLQCHLPARFASAEHHHHEAGTAGANCLNCHMPEKTYMVVDPRRDHSFRIPRPDQSLDLGTPNACNQCHTDRTPQWAATQFAGWYPDPKPPFQHWAYAFAQARAGAPGAGSALASLILDPQTPDIAQATAVFELRQYLDASTIGALRSALADESPLVRMAAVRATDAIPIANRLPYAGPLLQDDSLVVRTGSAGVLAGVSRGQMNEAGGKLLDKAVAEYIQTQQLNADRVEGRLNLGNTYSEMNEPVMAEREYLRGISLAPGFVPGYINLAELYRTQGLNERELEVLHSGLSQQPEAAALHHSLGLALIRKGDSAMSLVSLSKAAELAPEAARYAYVYAIALNSAGQAEKAVSTLEQAYGLHPNYPDILFALATINRDSAKLAAAAEWANKLLLLLPEDPGVQQLVQSLKP